MYYWVIHNSRNGLFWDNSMGWVSWETADKFTETETKEFMLPDDGMWLKVRDDSAPHPKVIVEVDGNGVCAVHVDKDNFDVDTIMFLSVDDLTDDLIHRIEVEMIQAY